MNRASRHKVLFYVLLAILGASVGWLVSRVLFQAFLNSIPLFIVLTLSLFGLGMVLLVRAVWRSRGRS